MVIQWSGRGRIRLAATSLDEWEATIEWLEAFEWIWPGLAALRATPRDTAGPGGQAMTVSREKIGIVQEVLCHQTAEGLLFFYCAQSLHRAFEQNRLMKSSHFFQMAYQASVREAILTLARITREQGDSITIHHFFNLVENNPRLLSPDDTRAVKQSVKTHKELLARYQPLIESVCEQRDRVLAHFDKKHINDPSSLFEHPQGVNLTELGDCLREILSILKHWGVEYFDRDFIVSHFQGTINGDVDILLDWMNTYGRPGEWIRAPQFGEK
jgi:hypothetical protein